MKNDVWPKEFPGTHWYDNQEEEAVCDVLRRGAPFRYYGLKEPRHVTLFEERAKTMYGVNYALGVNSGTGALITAMAAFGIGPGDEVIIPAFMWIATVAAIINANAIPVICEVDDSFTLDPEDLERKITDRTALIVAVHMAGAPTDMDAIMDIALQHGLPVLEDVAQCNGGSFGSAKLGTIGDAGIFSLQINKNITAGEGGLAVTNNEAVYRRLVAAHDVGHLWINGSPTETTPDVLMWGSGRRMSEMTGAVAAIQITKLSTIVSHMRASHDRIAGQITEIPGVSLRRLTDPDGHTGPFIIIILENEEKAFTAAQAMKDAGLYSIFRLADYGLHIYCNIPQLVNKTPLSNAGNPWNLPANSGRDYRYEKGTCPKSDELFARSILIPIPSRLTPEQEQWAVETIKASISG